MTKKWVTALAFIVLGMVTACSSYQVSENTTQLVDSMNRIREQQVLRNLSAAIDNPSSVPSQVVLGTGQANVVLTFTSSFQDQDLRSNLFSNRNDKQQPTLGFNDAWTLQWQVTPVTDRDDLATLRSVYALVAVPLNPDSMKVSGKLMQERMDTYRGNVQGDESVRIKTDVDNYVDQYKQYKIDKAQYDAHPTGAAPKAPVLSDDPAESGLEMVLIALNEDRNFTNSTLPFKVDVLDEYLDLSDASRMGLINELKQGQEHFAALSAFRAKDISESIQFLQRYEIQGNMPICASSQPAQDNKDPITVKQLLAGGGNETIVVDVNNAGGSSGGSPKPLSCDVAWKRIKSGDSVACQEYQNIAGGSNGDAPYKIWLFWRDASKVYIDNKTGWYPTSDYSIDSLGVFGKYELGVAHDLYGGARACFNDFVAMVQEGSANSNTAAKNGTAKVMLNSN